MRTLLVLALSVIAACARSGSGSGDDASPGVDARPADAYPNGDGPVGTSRVYAHSGKDLYRIDSNNLSVTHVGPFGSALGSASMTDIAVDKQGHMIGVSLSKIFTIDPDTGTATMLSTFQGSGNLTSLSFVPMDPNDPNSAERLITAGDAGDVYQIDPATGMTTRLGNYGTYNGHQIVSSGDIVSVYGLGTLATVNVTASLNDPDYLAWINPDWTATPIGTASTGYDKIFGLAFWGGTVFGFVDDGATAGTGTLVTIDKTTGVATPVNTQPFRWYGAGSTTVAPIIP